jgi:hypothetical protein
MTQPNLGGALLTLPRQVTFGRQDTAAGAQGTTAADRRLKKKLSGRVRENQSTCPERHPFPDRSPGTSAHPLFAPRFQLAVAPDVGATPNR